jgi:hypothetical protein
MSNEFIYSDYKLIQGSRNLKVMGGAQTISFTNAQYNFQENQLTIKK